MDENPYTKISVESGKEKVPLYAGLALAATLGNDTQGDAQHWIRQIPRSERGRVKIALDDMDMMMSRMGKDG